jgi:hypothetical protein
MSFVKLMVLVCLMANLMACAFVPKVDSQQDYAKHCELYTKELTLDAVSLGGLDCGTSSSCLAIAAIVPATTLLVSGSIVLVGNTLHWLEYQGSCDESVLQSSFNALIRDDESDSTEINSDAIPSMMPDSIDENVATDENTQK